MIPIDRQTLTLIAVVVCMVGLVVVFKELRAAKDDVEGLKGFSMNVIKHMQESAPPVPAPETPAPAPEPTTSAVEDENN